MNKITDTNKESLLYCLAVFVAVLALVLSGVIGCSTIQKPVEADKNYLTTCGALESVKGASYCYSFRQHEEIKSSLIYFSGLGDDHTVLQKSLFDQRSLKEIVSELHNTAIIVVSFGKSYLVTSYPDKWQNPKDATVEKFKVKILPEINQRFQLPKPWTLMGHSRGGQDTATLCTQIPEEFDKCVMLNPMIGCDDIYDFFDFSCFSSVIFRSSYTKAQWEKHGQNAMLARTTKIPPTIVSACSKDAFKLYAPTKNYVAKAQLLGLPILFIEDPDGCSHQTFPVQNVLQFIQPPIPIIKLDEEIQ